MKKAIYSIALPLWFLMGTSFAATRTMQFVGSAFHYTGKIGTADTTGSTACAVVIVNTGLTNQKVTAFRFQIFDSATNKMTNTAPSLGLIYNSGAGDSCGFGVGASPCLDAVIRPGGVYVATALLDPSVLAGSFVALCAGQFTVADVIASQPGAVVASGAISLTTEFGVRGGQFMGALYWSGSRVPVSDAATATTFQVAQQDVWTNSGTPPEGLMASLGGGTWLPFNQMSMFCAQACEISTVGDPAEMEWCQTICGSQTDPPAGHTGKHLFGYAEANQTPGFLERKAKDAHPQWSGGNVMEMIVGPYNSICSGNAGYFAAGKTDFSHTDTIDPDGGLVMASPYTAGKGPPERLYCAHNHLRDDPFGTLNVATRFPVNGGSPF